jgi:hypothetical protein
MAVPSYAGHVAELIFDLEALASTSAVEGDLDKTVLTPHPLVIGYHAWRRHRQSAGRTSSDLLSSKQLRHRPTTGIKRKRTGFERRKMRSLRARSRPKIKDC